jgi:hypothetical protein
MAIRLEFINIIVPRGTVARLADLPAWMATMNPNGGSFLETCWYDAHLFREGAMNRGDAEDIVEVWRERGLTPLARRAGQDCWKDLCVALSGRGPTLPCDWLEYDAGQNCVWLKGTSPGEVVGGTEQSQEFRARLEVCEALAEAAYTAMYDSRTPKDEFEDACEAFAEATALARFLHRLEDMERFTARRAHVEAVYRSQFRM